MLKMLSLAGAALAVSATALVPVVPAMAQRSHFRGDDRGYYDTGATYRGDTYRSYRARQKCNDGDGGTIVGAIAGGLLGHTVVGRHDRLLGTAIGAGVGALAGRAIDRSDRPGYCRR